MGLVQFALLVLKYKFIIQPNVAVNTREVRTLYAHLILFKEVIIMTPNFVCLDFEASSLGIHSYPISVGFYGYHHSGYMLIKPQEDWLDWDERAELIHCLRRSDLISDGVDALDVIHQLNASLRGCIVVTDCFKLDQRWLRKLYSACNIAPTFQLVDISQIEMLSTDKLKLIYSKLMAKEHNAHDDAKLLYELISQHAD